MGSDERARPDQTPDNAPFQAPADPSPLLSRRALLTGAAPQSLTPDEVYALVAWLLAQNGIIADDAVMDAQTLPAVRMPNRHGFVPDPRPDVPHR